VPLQLALAGSTVGGFTPEQLHAFASFSMQWKQAALLLSWAFYGLDELAGGFLIFRSRFLPRILGICWESPDSVTSRMAFSASWRRRWMPG